MRELNHIRFISIPGKAEVDPQADFLEVTLIRILVTVVALFKRLF